VAFKAIGLDTRIKREEYWLWSVEVIDSNNSSRDSI
jgi:hypothetical protein